MSNSWSISLRCFLGMTLLWSFIQMSKLLLMAKTTYQILRCVQALTPFSIVSLLSLHFMKRTTFQLVLQFTEFT